VSTLERTVQVSSGFDTYLSRFRITLLGVYIRRKEFSLHDCVGKVSDINNDAYVG
jgi:hypothetical protein